MNTTSEKIMRKTDHAVTEYFTLRVPSIRNKIPAIHNNDTASLISAIRISIAVCI